MQMSIESVRAMVSTQIILYIARLLLLLEPEVLVCSGVHRQFFHH
jgi:hypothetical protein